VSEFCEDGNGEVRLGKKLVLERGPVAGVRQAYGGNLQGRAFAGGKWIKDFRYGLTLPPLHPYIVFYLCPVRGGEWCISLVMHSALVFAGLSFNSFIPFNWGWG
jgi:hypothetical protein